MTQCDITKEVHAVSNVLSDQQKISAENRTQSRFALNKVGEEKTHGEETSEALGCVWQNENESALLVIHQRLRKMRGEHAARPFD